MKKNTITIIEVIIILCVVVVAVRWWGYKKPDSKVSFTAIAKSNTSKYKPYIIHALKCDVCPMCGRDKLIYIDYRKCPSEKEIYTGKFCDKCNWSSFKCPYCSSDLMLSTDGHTGYETSNPGWVVSVKCKKCDWQSGSSVVEVINP